MYTGTTVQVPPSININIIIVSGTDNTDNDNEVSGIWDLGSVAGRVRQPEA